MIGVQWAAGAAVILVIAAAIITSFGLKGAGQILPKTLAESRSTQAVDAV